MLLDLLEKQTGGRALKDITDSRERQEALESSLLVKDGARIANCSVLLVDDLFRSGATLAVATSLLKKAGARTVCVLAMTKTRSNR